MNLALEAHDIRAISIVFPLNPHQENEMQMCKITPQKLELLRTNSGIKRHFSADENTFSSDLACEALGTLLRENILHKDELDMLLICSFSPDFLAPAMSSLVAKNLQLSSHTLCVDIVGFCPSFLSALSQAFLFLNHKDISKIALICTNTKSKKIPPTDKITYLNNSDSASCVLLEKSSNPNKAAFSQKIFPALACEETKPLRAFNANANDFIEVNASLILSFVSENFPLFFEEFLTSHKLKREAIGQFFFQSPNVFVKEKLMQNLHLNLPSIDETLENFGDTTINKLPIDLALCANLDPDSAGGGGICLKTFISKLLLRDKKSFLHPLARELPLMPCA